MYAIIHSFQVRADSAEVFANLGWRLARGLAEVGGSVATVALQTEHGALVTVSLFDDRASLGAAGIVARQWSAEHDAVLTTAATELARGEVVVQKGL